LQNVAPHGNENIFNIIDNFCNKYNQIPLMPDLLELETPELPTL
tara:strand:+ start:2538 stop:2669 length:132 start_codon:yes stop_codon:yes gene_type:complete